MKKSLLKLIVFTIMIVCSGCASSYRPIYPTKLTYNAHDSHDGIEMSYIYDVLKARGNKVYSNNESEEGLKLIAVKITNNTDSIINVGRDIAFYSGDNQIFPMVPIAIQESLKQNVYGYLFYLLLTPLNLTITTSSSTNSYPIGLLVGPSAAISNILTANLSNKRMLKNLYDYDIISSVIQKGETIYGLIGFRDIGYAPISVKLKNKIGG